MQAVTFVLSTPTGPWRMSLAALGILMLLGCKLPVGGTGTIESGGATEAGLRAAIEEFVSLVGDAPKHEKLRRFVDSSAEPQASSTARVYVSQLVEGEGVTLARSDVRVMIHGAFAVVLFLEHLSLRERDERQAAWVHSTRTGDALEVWKFNGDQWHLRERVHGPMITAAKADVLPRSGRRHARVVAILQPDLSAEGVLRTLLELNEIVRLSFVRVDRTVSADGMQEGARPIGCGPGEWQPVPVFEGNLALAMLPKPDGCAEDHAGSVAQLALRHPNVIDVRLDISIED